MAEEGGQGCECREGRGGEEGLQMSAKGHSGVREGQREQEVKEGLGR